LPGGKIGKTDRIDTVRLGDGQIDRLNVMKKLGIALEPVIRKRSA